MWVYKSGRNYMPCHDKYVGWGEPNRNFEDKYIVGYIEDDHMCVVHIVNSVFDAIRLVNYLNGGNGTIPKTIEDLLR